VEPLLVQFAVFTIHEAFMQRIYVVNVAEEETERRSGTRSIATVDRCKMTLILRAEFS